jgi:hypothetical protein
VCVGGIEVFPQLLRSIQMVLRWLRCLSEDLAVSGRRRLGIACGFQLLILASSSAGDALLSSYRERAYGTATDEDFGASGTHKDDS